MLRTSTLCALVLIDSTQVKLALKHGVPFVPAAGGHSPYSTIGRDGIVVDTTNYSVIKIDDKTQQVTITPGVVNGQLIKALDEQKLVTGRLEQL